MLIQLTFLLLLIGSVVSESVKLPISSNRLEFDLWPYKKWEVDALSYASRYWTWTCFNMSTPIRAKDLQFILEIEEFTKWKVNVDRFGPTTSSRGKQIVNMEVYDEEQNLVQSRHGLENGETVLHLSVFERQNFEFCLINLSTDSSWNSIDTVKQVSISITSNSLISKQKWNLITEGDLELLHDSRETLFSLVSADSGQELRGLDVEHRNLNESTYNVLLVKFISLLILLGVGHLVVIPFILYRILSRSHTLKNANKFKAKR